MRITVLFLMFSVLSIYGEVAFASDENQQQQNAQQLADKALTSQQNKKNSQTNENKGNSSLPKSRLVGHTEPPKSQRNQQSVDNEQAELDKGLIDAQIDDVLSSAEFLALESSALFSPLDDKDGNNKSTKKGKKNKRNSDDPEFLLNQLDASDLMDYVAEDDLWKEQLTIEDKP